MQQKFDFSDLNSDNQQTSKINKKLDFSDLNSSDENKVPVQDEENNSETFNLPLLGEKHELPPLMRMILNIQPSLQKPLAQGVSERTQALGRGFQDIGEGAKQVYLEALGKPGEAEKYTQQAQDTRNLYDVTSAGQDPLSQEIRSQTSSLPFTALVGGALGKPAAAFIKEGGYPALASAKSLLSKIISGGVLGGAAKGTEFIPEGESRLANAEKGELLGAGLALLPQVPGLAREFTPSSLVGRFANSPLSKEELARNLELTAGTGTNLGEVIGSPNLKGIAENVLTKVPFAGSERVLQDTGKEILNRGENLVNQYLGDTHPLEINEKLGNALIKANKVNTKIKNDLYTNANNIADESGLQLTLPHFSAQAKKYADDLESTNILQFEPEVKSLLNKLKIYKNPVKTEEIESNILDKSGNPITETKTTYPSLKEANIVSGKLNTIANKYRSSPSPSDRHAANVLGNLSKTLKTDIKQEISNSGNEELTNAFDTAEKNYKQNFSGFLDKNVYKFANGNEAPEDIISKFLQTGGKKDKVTQLKKLLRVLPEEDHNLVRSAYFSKAFEGPENMRVVNPNKLSTLWRNLGQNQKKALFPNENERRQFDNYEMLVGKNQKAVNLMWNPATGKANMDIIGALMLMHPVGAIKEILMSKLGTKLLTGQEAREKIVNRIIKRKESE